MAAQTDTRTENLAKLACAYAGFAWGLFWIPLRFMNDAGIAGAWATVIFYGVCALIMAPFLAWYGRAFARAPLRVHVIGFTAGLALVLYSNGVVYTEVIRAMLLFYLTPVWSTLLARVWLKEPITPIRIAAIALGLGGMLVIFGVDVGVPLPRNAGDWMGLCAGMVWAMAAVMMRETPSFKAMNLMISYSLWCFLIAGAMMAMPLAADLAAPDWQVIAGVLPWLVPMLAVVVVPASLAVMWGTPLLNPGVVGLLFMTEISIGTITAAIWAGEPFGVREILGVVLISLSGIAEVTVPLSRLRLRRGAPWNVRSE